MSAPPGPWNNRGFTLLELIVVMVLIALTTSLALPQVANFLYADHLKASVRKLVGLIARSSQLAQERQAPHLLKYIERERRFVLEPEKRSETNGRIGRNPGTGKERKDGELRLADSITVRDVWSLYGGLKPGGEMVVRFNGSGYVEPTVIHLREEGRKDFSLVLSPFLGSVQVMDGYVDPEREDLFR